MPEPDLLSSLQPPTLQSVMAPMDTLGQVGVGLAGIGRVQNPFLVQEQEKFRQQVEMIRLQQSVQRDRFERQKLGINLGMDFVKMGGLAARTGASMLTKGLSALNLTVPPGFEESLAQGQYSLTDLESIQTAKIRGLPLEDVIRANPKIPPKTVKSIYQQPLTDDARRLFKLKTDRELQRESTDDAIKTLDLLAKQRESLFPEMTLDKKLAESIELAHRKASGGKSYYEGDPTSQAQARQNGQATFQEQKVKEAAAMAGARAGELIATEKSGGTFYHKPTGQYHIAVKQSDLLLHPNDYASLSGQQMQTAQLLKRGIEQNQRLRELTPKVLAAVPGKNLANFLKQTERKWTGASPELREWLALVTEENIELARALGPGQFRIQLLHTIAKDTGPHLGIDTIQTALTLIDVRAITLENAIRGLHQVPIIRNDQRIGPGTYWATDQQTGQEVPLILKPYEISDPRYTILRVR